ncbi:cytochrome P450 736A117-like [Salvia splendens]|uniref:cytochrome P450 736A117-like n=1 Tax=Salvia splendens TaxID=180675 RepID=UPI001C2697C4|nr:cytochrome P450 736A117-like [Salvia splendens]
MELILTSLVSLLLLWFITRIFLKSSTKKNLPPSPSKLPIIGNLHQLTSHPHRGLHSLAQKHGPLMLLHFGSVPVLVVSSADTAREIMITHHTNFANRPLFKAMKKLFYDCKDVTFTPYSEYWRQMRSIFVLQMLSNKRVRYFGRVREEEAALLVKRIEGCVAASAPVDLRRLIAETNGQVIFRSSFGGRYGETENGKKLLRLIRVSIGLLGEIHIGDFIPWLGWIGRVNGFDKRLDTTAKEMDQVLESVIQERQETGQDRDGEDDFLDILLQIYNQDVSIGRDSIKALLLDVFVGGTDSISTSLEWTMSELLRQPRVMEKLQSEVRGIVKQKQRITKDDLEKMGYMKAVIKENMRLHPPFPLSPRIASKDVQIKGYDIAAGTMAMVSMWAIGRELISWDEPDKFMPERFLNSSVDFKGQDYELIPFGTGRRACPGIGYATASMELVLANLMQKFDWKLPNGILPKHLDMTESSGITVHKALPLLALASRAQ